MSHSCQSAAVPSSLRERAGGKNGGDWCGKWGNKNTSGRGQFTLQRRCAGFAQQHRPLFPSGHRHPPGSSNTVPALWSAIVPDDAQTGHRWLQWCSSDLWQELFFFIHRVSIEITDQVLWWAGWRPVGVIRAQSVQRATRRDKRSE